jgi:hypothetical protein
MDINAVDTIYEVMRQLKERVAEKGCKEGKIVDETCKHIFNDFDDWCNICALETAVYFLGESLEVNKQITNEALNASRQTNQGVTKVPNGNGGSSSKS